MHFKTTTLRPQRITSQWPLWSWLRTLWIKCNHAMQIRSSWICIAVIKPAESCTFTLRVAARQWLASRRPSRVSSRCLHLSPRRASDSAQLFSPINRVKELIYIISSSSAVKPEHLFTPRARESQLKGRLRPPLHLCDICTACEWRGVSVTHWLQQELVQNSDNKIKYDTLIRWRVLWHLMKHNNGFS